MPPGAGIALSAAWRYEPKPAALSALSLAVGAAARRAIADVSGVEVGLKWPNDLILAGRKLGGILVDLGTTAGGACHVVAGIGINVAVPAEYLAQVSSSRHGATDLAAAIAPDTIARSALAAALIERLVELFAGYAASGFAPYRAEWLKAHVLDGARVELETPVGVETGTVRGIEDDGALIVENAQGAKRRFITGDVTLRPAP
jgi:BirA family biotin operon repressor/biotin-[acetyl-CoA-carboxylase] ligase